MSTPTKRTYVIGDVQGCLDSLQGLLAKIQYDPNTTRLWFTGDLINRGPASLATLRFIRGLPADTVCVLGNHDLALLTAAHGFIQPKPQDTYAEILQAPDAGELVNWLRQKPILHYSESANAVLTHAGVYPGWDLEQARRYANELETVLRGPDYVTFLQHMFGNQPDHWDESLTGWDRLRFITNAFTRMRFCRANGALDLQSNGRIEDHPGKFPWFSFPTRIPIKAQLFFGHWAALSGQCHVSNIFALDTGCVWGHALTAFCVESKHYVTMDCSQYLR